MRICLLKAATHTWVRNTASFLFVIDYIHRSGSFEILQAKVKGHLSTGSARYSARGGPIIVSFMYIT